jgi:hypothetical protein
MSSTRPFTPIRLAPLWTIAAISAAAISLAAQDPAASTGTSGTVASGTARVQGCLAKGPSGGTFVLRNATPVVASTGAPTSSPGAGTSATGDTPSGSIDGKNPTGSTATTTTTPTPAVGRPGATANPASPSYNQESAQGTTGSVAGHDSSSTEALREYVLTASNGLDLAAHAGHLVEVTGTVVGQSETRAGSRTTAEIRAPERKAPAPPAPAGSTAAAPTLDVRALHDLADTCPAQ